MALLRKADDSQRQPSVFPTYLMPTIPYRRKSRQSSTDSTNSSLSTLSVASTLSNPFTRCPTPTPISSSSSMVIPPTDKFLNGHRSHIHCAKCSTDLCLTSQIISKGFTGRHGRAYLVQGTPTHINLSTAALPNTYQGKSVARNLVTGPHTVSDISCAICGSVLGWKYVEASEESQKYKVGKFILETKRVRASVNWEDEGMDDADDDHTSVMPLSPGEIRKIVDGPEGDGGPDDITFDSQDEDECEDLFAGVWSPQLAARRRQRRRDRFSRREKEKAVAARSRSRDTLS